MAHRILYRKNSQYQRITVAENAAGSMRYLYSSRKDEKQGGIYLNDPFKLYFEYCRVSLVSLAFLGREPRDVLFVGLGAGSIPRYLSRYYPHARIEIVEVDRAIFETAIKYFFFEETDNMKVRIADGRSFLRSTPHSYDMVFLDAYLVNDVPFHLCTVEFLKEVSEKLRDEGIVVSNIVGRDKNRAFDSLMATYSQVFPYIHVFEGISSYNNVIVASFRQVDRKSLEERAHAIQWDKKMDVKLHKIAARPFQNLRTRPSGKILTDRATSAVM